MAKKVQIDIVAKDKTKKAVASSKKGLSGIKKFALAATAALATVGAGKIITNLVNVGKEMENLQVRFKFLFKDAEEGAKAFNNLSEFAGRVPFSLDEIAKASGNLAVVAKDAKHLTRILEITGNVAAFTGLDFEQTASQIQRAFSGGIAAADVFREKGLRQVLGFEAGAKISVEETIKKFEEVFGSGGRLGNVTDALATTLTGTLSMISDKFLQFKMAINESFFAELKLQFGDLNTALEENKEVWLAWGKSLGEGLGTVLTTTIDTFKFLAAASNLMNRALDEAGIVGEALRLKMNPLAPIMNSIGVATESADISLKGMTDTLNGLLQPAEEVADGFGFLQEVIAETAEAIAKKAEADKVALLLNAEMTNQMYAFDAQLNNQKESLAALNDITEEANKVWTFRHEIMRRAIMDMEEAKIAQDELNQSINQQFGFEDKRARQQQQGIENTQKRNEAEKQSKKDLFDQAKKLAEEGSMRSKKLFRLNQALAIGQAIMSTYAGAAKELERGGIFGILSAGLVIATGMAQVANIRAQQPPAQFGGVRQQGSPFLVGERGPELFTPSTAGTVTPNHQLGRGGAVVNFNITTVDASSFGVLLDTRRGQIVGMINSALNNQGKAALV